MSTVFSSKLGCEFSGGTTNGVPHKMWLNIVDIDTGIVISDEILALPSSFFSDIDDMNDCGNNCCSCTSPVRLVPGQLMW